MISVVLMSLVITAVDVSITVIQKQSVAVGDRTNALNNIQLAQEAITRDLHAVSTWNTPAPTSTTPVTATTLNFTASLDGQTPTINIALNTTTHALAITCTDASAPTACNGNNLSIANIDSSTVFTLTASEVTNSNNTPANAFYFTNISSVVTLDTPSVTAPRKFQTTLTEPNLVPFNILYACQLALQQNGATGSC
jgi:hypothetical protein